MSRTVTALFNSPEEAEWALDRLSREVSLAHGEVIARGPDSAARLDRLDLTPSERENCERSIQSGDYMLLAQVRGGESTDHIVEVLQRIVAERDYRMDEAEALASPSEGAIAMPGPGGTIEEERIPLIEEELRVGTREVVRGGARVRTHVEEVPVSQEIELADEHATLERRPVNRRINEAELEQAGLLRERVIEIAQIREEAVVTKEAFVREEVLVRKSVDRRMEQIHETVRRTEVDAERLPGSDDRSAFPNLGSDGSGRAP